MNRPNILMVLADQLNAHWLGCAGHPQALTPRLDAFAATGVRFDNAYCQNPICTPSRVSILSGQYCHNHGYYGLSGNANFNLPNLFRHLRAHDYRTAAYGKLHLPCAPRNWIADDVDAFGDTYESIDGRKGASEFLLGLEQKGLREYEDSWHNPACYSDKAIPIDAMHSKLPFEETQEVWCARQAMAFMQQERERPFCIQVAFQKPHHPLLPNERFWNMYSESLDLPVTWDMNPAHRPPHFREQWAQWRKYAWEFGDEGDTFEDFVRRSWRGTLACVTQIDHVFGMLMDFLRDNDLEQNTIVVFGSDHGAYHGVHGQLEKAPGICSDEVCRVPMLWRVPHATVGGTVNHALVENVDIAPTLCVLADVPAMGSADGADLTPLLQGDTREVHRVAVTENAWSKAIRWDKWRLVFYPRDMFDGPEQGELYDLAADPQERQNLYASPDHATIVQEGKTRLLEWLIQTTRLTTPPNATSGYAEKRAVILESDGRATNAVTPGRRDDIMLNYL